MEVIIPSLSPLPGPNRTGPGRRHTAVCSNLLIERETMDLDKADLRCRKRPGVRMAADWVLDVCLSSWCRNCPFLGDDGEDR